MRAVAVASLLLLGLAGGLRADDDRSLEVMACIERGMPAPDRTWSGRDFEAAAGCLEALAREDVGLLPRRGSARSGALFERMCADDNVAAWRDHALDGALRIQVAGAMLQGVNRLLTIYASAVRTDPTLKDEAGHVAAYMLRMIPPLFDLTDQLTEGLDPADPASETRKGGLERMRSGLATMFGGVLQWLGSEPGTGGEDRRCLAAALGDVYPAVRARLTPTTAAELGPRLRQLADAEADSTIKADLLRACGAPPAAPTAPTEAPPSPASESR